MLTLQVHTYDRFALRLPKEPEQLNRELFRIGVWTGALSEYRILDIQPEMEMPTKMNFEGMDIFELNYLAQKLSDMGPAKWYDYAGIVDMRTHTDYARINYAMVFDDVVPDSTINHFYDLGLKTIEEMGGSPEQYSNMQIYNIAQEQMAKDNGSFWGGQYYRFGSFAEKGYTGDVLPDRKISSAGRIMLYNLQNNKNIAIPLPASAVDTSFAMQRIRLDSINSPHAFAVYYNQRLPVSMSNSIILGNPGQTARAMSILNALPDKAVGELQLKLSDHILDRQREEIREKTPSAASLRKTLGVMEAIASKYRVDVPDFDDEPIEVILSNQDKDPTRFAWLKLPASTDDIEQVVGGLQLAGADDPNYQVRAYSINNNTMALEKALRQQPGLEKLSQDLVHQGYTIVDSMFEPNLRL